MPITIDGARKTGFASIDGSLAMAGGAPGGAAGGDLNGTYPNPGVDDLAVGGDVSGTLSAVAVGDLSIASQADGDLLQFNGVNWVRVAKGAAGQALVSDGTDVAWADRQGEFLFIFASGALAVAESLGRIFVPFDITITGWRGHSVTGSTGAGDKFALTRSGTADDPLSFATTVIADTAAAMGDGDERGSTDTVASGNVDAGSWLKLNCTGVAATPGVDHQAVILFKRR